MKHEQKVAKEKKSIGNSKTSKIQSCQTKRKKQNKKDEEVDVEKEKEDDLCLRCLKPFSNSLPGAEWIQYSSCHQWAYMTSVKKELKGLFYECLYCNDLLVVLDEEHD